MEQEASSGSVPGVRDEVDAQIRPAEANAINPEAEPAVLGDRTVAGASGGGAVNGRSVEAQLHELADSLEALQQRAAASREQAEATGQRAEELRGAASQLQAGIRSHSQSALEAAQQLEELVGKLAGTPQSPEMVEWLRQLRDSLAQLVALGEPRP